MGAAIALSEKDKPKRMFSVGFTNCRPRKRSPQRRKKLFTIEIEINFEMIWLALTLGLTGNLLKKSRIDHNRVSLFIEMRQHDSNSKNLAFRNKFTNQQANSVKQVTIKKDLSKPEKTPLG
jgi:hypothetical protein